MDTNTTNINETVSAKICPVCGLPCPPGDLACPHDGVQLPREKEDKLIGTVLGGHYEIISLLGAGGMSAVYKGRHELLDRIVAIKVMHSHLMSQQGSLARFQQEAKAASHLTHPNIIGVHDFGVSPEEQVYLVMDYLEGESLHEILQHEKRLPAERAVKIFTQVCDALTHAHHKGIIHRDLKPSNIMLINTEDQTDLVKIVDFGIAKLLPGAEIEGQRLTQTGEVFGSPMYMSPEQCTGDTLDVRSDIYSLGCVMYETLSGRPPFIGQNMLETMYIRLAESAKPFDPQLKIPKQLEAVVLIAVATNRENRYQSMAELKADLNKAMEAAGSGTTRLSSEIRQRLNKAKRSGKNKRPGIEQVFIIGLMTLMLLSGLMYKEFTGHWPGMSETPFYQNLWTQYDQDGQRQYDLGNYTQAEKSFLSAVKEAEKFGEEDKRLSVSLTKLSKLYRSEGKETEAAQLDSRLASISAQNPLDNAGADGSNVSELADLTLSLVPKSFKKGREVEYQKLAEKLEHLAALCIKQQNYVKAEQLFKEALDIEQQSLGPENPAVAHTLTRLADMYNDEQGNYSKAEDLYKQSLAIRLKALGPTSPDVAANFFDLAIVNEDLGRYQQAEDYYKKSLSIYQQIFGQNDPDVAHVTAGLAGLYRLESKLPEAQLLYTQALDIYKRTEGSDHPVVAQILNNLAGLSFTQGNYSQALPLYQQALQIYEKTHGSDHPSVATIINNLGTVYLKQGDYAKAEPLYKRALSIRQRILPPEHPGIAQSLNSLAELYRLQHNYSQAEQLFKRALSITENSFGLVHPEVARVLSSIGQLYTDEGLYPQAEEFYKRALEIRHRVYGAKHPEIASSLKDLATVNLEQKNYAQAESYFKESLAMQESLLGMDHPEIAATLDSYANLLFKTNRIDQAFNMKLRSMSIWIRSHWFA